MKLQITPSDQLKGKPIPPGFYIAEVTEVVEKPAKGDGSQNWNVCFTIREGKYSGVPVYKTFNEKGAGFASSFVEACGGKLNPDETYELDFQKTIGTKLKIHVVNSLYNNNMTNQIDGYMPL